MKYENYYNLDDYLRKNLVGDNKGYLRWLKDIINTKESMFSYENLPEGLTSEIVETSLMFNNFLCFWKSPVLGFVLCRYMYGGDFDIYWKPVKVNLLSISGKPIAYNVPYEDIILVKDNRMDIIPFLTLSGWIEKIMEEEKTLDVLVRLVRFPTILTGTREQMQELKSLLKKNINCEGFALADKGFKDHIEQYPIQLPAKLQEVYFLMDKYKTMALASMGISGVQEKSERLVKEEVNTSNDYTDFVYEGMYNERKLFVESTNKKFGTNIILKETYVENRKEEQDLMGREEELTGGKENGLQEQQEL